MTVMRKVAGEVAKKAAKREAPVVASVVRFGTEAPRVAAVLQRDGWQKTAAGWMRNGKVASLSTQGTYLHYSADGGRTWKNAPLQYLRDGNHGAVLRGVTPGTEVRVAPHVELMSTDAVGRRYWTSFFKDWLTKWGEWDLMKTLKP